MSVQLIIPMSGIGLRFQEAGYSLPKPLIRVAGKTIINHVIEMFPGIDDVLFIVNKNHYADIALGLKDILQSLVPSCQIVAIEPHKLGPAWAISQAREFVKLDSKIIVNYCDFACKWNFPDFLDELNSGLDGLIATYTGFHPHMLRTTKYAYVKKDHLGFLNNIQEKDSYTPNPMSEEASSGTYAFKSGSTLLTAIDNQILRKDVYNGEYYMSLTYKNMIEQDMKIRTFLIDQFLQWGTPEDLQEFEEWRKFFKFRSEPKESATGIEHIGLLAAGAGTRFYDGGYSIPKPFLPLHDSILASEAIRSIDPHPKAVTLLMQEKFDSIANLSIDLMNFEVEILRVSKLTQGQASSAKELLREIHAENCVIATCDSLIYPQVRDYSNIKDKSLGVWVTEPSHFARTHPEQFGWVLADNEGLILKSRVKTIPDDFDTWKVITGTFFFGNPQEGSSLIANFESLGERVNGEFYLDSVLAFAKNSGWQVFAMSPIKFVSLGTPDEYETYCYWARFFDNHPLFISS